MFSFIRSLLFFTVWLFSAYFVWNTRYQVVKITVVPYAEDFRALNEKNSLLCSQETY